MTQKKMLVSVFLVLLVAFGWMQLLTSGGSRAQYNSLMESAQGLMERGLYQKAGQEYFLAAQEINTEEACSAAVEAFRAGYVQDEELFDDYQQALEQALEKQPAHTSFAQALAELYLEDGDARSAYTMLSNAVKNGADEQALEEMMWHARYACTPGWQTFSSVSPLCGGYYVVDRYGGWDYLSKDGETQNLTGYDFLGPIGEEGIRLVRKNDRWQLEGSDAVIQGFVTEQVQEAGVYAQGLIPLKMDGLYYYYDLLGEVQFGEYEMAGTFTKGTAAVQTADGWMLINSEGQPVSDTLYREIRLNGEGRYLVDDRMLADSGSGFCLFDKKENPIGSFNAEVVDILTEDGLFAFCQKEKWGFANDKGEIVIPAQYEQAKSFSNGLAAVFDGNKWGFINKNNELVIDFQFIQADYFNDAGFCMIQKESGEWSLLERQIKE